MKTIAIEYLESGTAIYHVYGTGVRKALRDKLKAYAYEYRVLYNAGGLSKVECKYSLCFDEEVKEILGYETESITTSTR